MLYITERKTEQRDLITGSVLHMISLFVVAYPHEVEKFEEDNFASFLIQARADGRLLKDKPWPTEFVETSRTRKGFLIKCSYTDVSAVKATEPMPQYLGGNFDEPFPL